MNKNLNNISYWDNDAINYDRRVKKSLKAYNRVIDLIIEYSDKNKIVLDIGTGTGEVPLKIYKYFKKIEAIDYSQSMIDIAIDKSKIIGAKNINFSIQDCYSLKYKDEMFDLIIILNLLHVIPNPVSVLNEAKRLIKKNGVIFIVSYLHNENIISRMISLIMKIKGHPINKSYKSKNFIELIKNSSFKILYKENIKNIMPLLVLIASK